MIHRLKPLTQRLSGPLLTSAALALSGPIALTSALLLLPSHAQAADAKPIAVYVEGPDADDIRSELVDIVPKGLSVLDESTFSEALKKQGQKGQMGNAMAIAKQRTKLVPRIRKAVENAGAQGAIIARVRKTRSGGRELWVLWISPTSDDVEVDKAIALDGSADDHKSAFKSELESILKPLAPNGSESSGSASGGEKDSPDEGSGGAGDEKNEPEEGSASTRVANEVNTAIVTASLSYQSAGRFFSYSDGLSSNLRPYDVFGPPMVNAELEFYPGAIADIKVARDIGLWGTFSMAFALDSATEGGEPVGTSFYRAGGGLRGRIRFGDEPASATLGISAGFTLLNFTFDAAEPLASEIPSASYKLIQGGLDIRIPAGPIRLILGGNFLYPLSGGAVYERQRDASVLGIEAKGGVGIPLATGFELRLTGEYTRFFSAFKPVVGDAYVAGGALDQFVWIRIGAAYAY